MLCIWTFIHVGRPQDILTFLAPYHIGDIIAGLTILSYYFTAQHRPQIRSYPEVRLFVFFVGIAALSTPFGYYPGKSLYFLIDFGIKTGIYLWLIAKLITSEERIQGILKTLFFSGAAMASSAILRAAVGGRIGGGATYDPNDLALILVTTLPIGIMLGLSSSSFRSKILFLVGAAFNLIGIIATQSRGGFLGLLALGGFMLSVKLPGISKKKFILILSVLAMIFGTYLGAEYEERIQTIFDESYSDVSAGSGRIGLWRQCLHIAKDHPILGVGPNAFSAAFGHYLETDKFPEELSRDQLGGKWQTAHNSFLLVLDEMGLPGLLLFLAINIRSFRNFHRVKAISANHNLSSNLSVQATTLQMALIGFLVCAFFLSQSYNMIIYQFCFLSGNMLRLTRSIKGSGDV
ncbi:MAG: O-antigen ligase family protein [Deltaproteobacteria bacterium]|nr:O-antigen ligase family protein [Deltaproteobacteria bacterium]